MRAEWCSETHVEDSFEPKDKPIQGISNQAMIIFITYYQRVVSFISML